MKQLYLLVTGCACFLARLSQATISRSPRLIYFAVSLALAGIIGQAEVAAQQGPSPQKILKRMDSDNDGKVAREEWKGQASVFGKIDTDKDGYLSSQELGGWFSKRHGGQPKSNSQGPSRSPFAQQAETRVTTKPAAIHWMDTHVHLRRGAGTYEGAARHAIKLMDESNIRTAVLMPPPLPAIGRAGNRYDVTELVKLADAHPGRFLFMGGGSLINGIIESTPPDQVTDSIKADFTRKANSILDSGARGFGELGVMHLGHFPGHPSYWVRPDHPLFLLLADIAGNRNAVIDIHMDVVVKDARTPSYLRGSNPAMMKANLDMFEHFVSHNQNARIVLAHAGWDVTGQWSAEVSRRLFDKHPNLYMSLKIVSKGGQSKNQLLKGTFSKTVSDGWLSVIKEYPDRFVIGSDSFIAEIGARGKAPGGMTMFNGSNIADFLEKLPNDLAKKIAIDNVIAIYGAP